MISPLLEWYVRPLSNLPTISVYEGELESVTFSSRLSLRNDSSGRGFLRTE
jgi:hypothetical protein